MNPDEIRIYPYRWIVLSAFMAITVVTQVLWITFAPITVAAAEFYMTSDLLIGLMAMSFMVVYIIVAIPAAWVIDTWGFRTAVTIGSILTAVGAIGRGVFATSFAAVLACQVVIAVGQPFVIGAITKIAARWFPAEERATAAGLGTLSSYLGVLIGMIVTPALAIRYEIPGMLLVYGIAATAAAAVFIVFSRERPPTPPCPPDQEARALMFDGLKSMVKQKDFLLLLVIFFIGLGIFNGISTWIETIVRPRGFSISQAGMLGGLMLIGGIAGAVVIPIISDLKRRRKPFLILALCGLLPGLVGVTFATAYWLLLVSGFFFGFFLLSAGPIGLQYGAEITRPAPEGTSASLLFGIGQVSGVVFIFGMDAIKSPDGSMTVSLIVLLALAAAGIGVSLLLRESPVSPSMDTVDSSASAP